MVSTQAPPPKQVLAALEELLGWSEMARSPQLAKFLRHIVEAKLRGDEAGIKAYSIAVDVFGRPPSFDPQADPIVRVQARRLRGLLQEYDRQQLWTHGVRITLPVGRYVPEFESLEAEAAQPTAGEDAARPVAVPAPAQRRMVGRRFWTQAIAAMLLVLALGLLLVGLRVLREPFVPAGSAGLPHEPIVYVSDFSNLSGNPEIDGFTRRLNDQLGSILAQFEDVEVGFVAAGKPMDQQDGAYLLSGTVAQQSPGLEVTATLSDVATGSVVWNRALALSSPVAGNDMAAMSTARSIMRDLGPFRGPVHAPGRKWLEDNATMPEVNGYICLLTYRFAREAAEAAAMARAIDCHRRLLEREPDLPLALAAQAWLEGRPIFDAAAAGTDIDLARPTELAERARQLAPESSFVFEQLGLIHDWQDNQAVAQRNFAIALGFEPLNTDARASYAISLARAGDWESANQQGRFAIVDAAYPSPWYYALPAVLALREGRFAEAIRDGRKTALASETGAVVALAAAALSRDSSAVTEFQPQVMSMENLRRHGIMPWIGLRINDPIVLDRIAAGLRAGGIPESALTARF